MRVIKWGKGSLFVYVFKKYRFLLKNTGLWASKYRFVLPEVGMSVVLAVGICFSCWSIVTWWMKKARGEKKEEEEEWEEEQDKEEG